MTQSGPTFPAFKEWAPIVAALGAGDQILVLRKGGIAEGRGGFRPAHERFWLFPTTFHPGPGKLKDNAPAAPAPAPSGCVALRWVAEAVHHHLETVWARVQVLAPHHFWAEDTIRERFAWGPAPSVHILVLRVYALTEPVVLPTSPTFGGCKSWIDIPAVPATDSLTPVLSDTEFAARLRALEL